MATTPPPFDKKAFASDLMTPDYRSPSAMQVGKSQQANPTVGQDQGGEQPGRIAPEDAGYADHSPGQEHCAACDKWQDGDGSQGCTLVLPPIQPTGWCKLFVPAGGGTNTPDVQAALDQGDPDGDGDDDLSGAGPTGPPPPGGPPNV